MSNQEARSRANMPAGTNSVLNRRTLSDDHRALARVLRPGMRVLDVGCGTGAITEDIAVAVAPGEVVGADTNEALLAEAQVRAQKHPNLSFRRCDAYDLPWTENFDLVTAARVLQWLDEPGAALAQMHQCLEAGGRVVVLDYNHEKAERRPSIPESMSHFYRAFLRWRADAGMNNAIADDLKDLLSSSGFKDLDVETSDEVSHRSDADFHERLSIWVKVADTRGMQLVRDGYIGEEERARASQEYAQWVETEAAYQRLYLRTAIGRK